MISKIYDIRSLSDFKSNATDFFRALKHSGHPIVLTIDGKAELVVQDAQSYQKLLEAVDRAEAIEGIKRGLQDVEAGRTRPFAEFDLEMRQKYGIQR